MFLFILLLLALQDTGDRQSSREEGIARATEPPTLASSKPSGLLSQALRAAKKAVAPKPDALQETTTERPRDLGSLRPNANTTSVVRFEERAWAPCVCHMHDNIFRLPKAS